MAQNSKTKHANPAVLVFAAFVFIAFVALAIASQATALEFFASPRILPPISMIFIGLVLIEAKTWKSVVLGLAVSAIVFFLATFVLFSFRIGPKQHTLSVLGMDNDAYVVQDREDVELSVLALDLANTELTVNGTSDALVESTHTVDSQILTIEELLVGHTYKTSVRSGDLQKTGTGEPTVVDLNLSKTKTTHLVGRLSDTTAELNLAGVQVEGLNLKLAHSEATITVGDCGKETHIKIDNMDSSVNFRLPESASVQITSVGETRFEGGSGAGGDIFIEYTGDGVDPMIEWY